MFACAARFAPRFTIEKEETLPMKMLRRSVCLLLCAALFLTLLAGVSHDCFGHSYFTAVSRAETGPAA